ncbi:MAG: hypothetical protein HZA01_05540 [Nitrospinae bacterium]|nr:hypothetical protein [Nitrospinota bacterium]
MSTTGSAAPLALIPLGIAAGAVMGAVYLCGKAMEVCPEEMERQKKLADEFQKEWGKNKIKKALAKEKIMLMPLTLTDPEPLLKAAAIEGFALNRPVGDMAANNSPIALRHKSGESILLSKDKAGKLEIITNNADLGHSILRRHTLNKVVLHYEKLGMNIQTRVVNKTDIEIIGKEKIPLLDGRVKVATKVRNDGSAEIDVSGLKGSRCQSIVKELVVYPRATGHCNTC